MVIFHHGDAAEDKGEREREREGEREREWHGKLKEGRQVEL